VFFDFDIFDFKTRTTFEGRPNQIGTQPFQENRDMFVNIYLWKVLKKVSCKTDYDFLDFQETNRISAINKSLFIHFYLFFSSNSSVKPPKRTLSPKKKLMKGDEHNVTITNYKFKNYFGCAFLKKKKNKKDIIC
jgi:hypothetical protein